MRIQEILDYRKPALRATLCGAVAALAVGAACLTSPALAQTPPAEPSAPSQAILVSDGTHHQHPTDSHSDHHAEHSAATLLWPVPDYTYVSRWCSEASGTQTGHPGADIAAEQGTDILAAAGGTVTYAGYDTEHGWMVVLDHGGTITTQYAHCSELFVEAGQTVKPGQKIAAVGSTGQSTGSHCHFEIRRNGEVLRIQDLFEAYTQQ